MIMWFLSIYVDTCDMVVVAYIIVNPELIKDHFGKMLGIFNSILYYYFSFKSRLYFGFHLF